MTLYIASLEPFSCPDRSYGVMVSTRDSESLDPGSTPGRTFIFIFDPFWLAKTKVGLLPARLELATAGS